MRTIYAPARSEIEIKRSRFIASCARTDCEEAAREFIAQIRREFPDARHHCTAFIIHQDTGPDTARSSDDGEPAGTAGNPMLKVLTESNLTNVTCVVTRYFGGTKLGTGGLVRAYSGAVQQVLEDAQTVRLVTQPSYQLQLPISEAGKVEAKLTQSGYQILARDFAQDATLRFSAPLETTQSQIESYLSSISGREISIETASDITREVRE
ncbi:YigZ family protein [Varibaculum cambriense]|uniref:YigZ family protein n=1 Tax=Varibaculum cambriense TaxID=184870 RepID=UPI0029082DDE|nr:YigZ family protein [Varibaculum cambriense]MDU5541558.1 YigZ family protein [Varibaculum cambriense]